MKRINDVIVLLEAIANSRTKRHENVDGFLPAICHIEVKEGSACLGMGCETCPLDSQKDFDETIAELKMLSMVTGDESTK